jgi:hypothetical protein
MGRFISKDPSGLAGGDPNFYRYTGNDPVNHTDRTGQYQQGNPLANLPIPGVPTFNPLAFAAPSLSSFGVSRPQSTYALPKDPILAQSQAYFRQNLSTSYLDMVAATASARLVLAPNR